ncbi:MAG: histidine phosphatase family protein [Desulfovibrionaceae bacterium]|nr:histidine phosphatase family protein [Desulfovibrionaceae bacterium]
MIVLMRHAHTAQAKGRCVGRTDVPLSVQGIAQAEEAAEALSGAGFVRLCASPSGRARDTLAPLADCLSMRADVLFDLDEIDMGEWDGLFFSDIRARFPDAYAERGSRFGGFRPPGGESFNDAADRAMAVLGRLASGPRPVLAVTHAGVIRAVLCRLTGHPMDDPFRFAPGHCRCTLLTPTEAGLDLAAENLSPADVASYLS